MRTVTGLLLIIFLFTGIILFAENEPKVNEKPVCPYTEKSESRMENVCPYSDQQKMKSENNICPYSGKSLEKSGDKNYHQNDIEYKRSKQLLDDKLNIVFT